MFIYNFKQIHTSAQGRVEGMLKGYSTPKEQSGMKQAIWER